MNIWEFVKEIITMYFIYHVIFIFITTSVVYLTYRLWKFIIPERETQVFVTNAPVIWQNHNDEDTKEIMIEAIKDYMENDSTKSKWEWEKNKI